jgi:hypothetical protein
MKASPDSFVGNSLEFLELLRHSGATVSDIILSDDSLTFTFSGDLAKAIRALEAATPRDSRNDEGAAS